MSSIQVILLRDMPPLGMLGDVVKVKRGFARNHLLPAGKAQTYTDENWAHFAKYKQEIIKQQQESKAALQKTYNELNGYLLQVVENAGSDGTLYGSITTSKIADLLKEQGYVINRNHIKMPNDEAIKQIGEHSVNISLTADLVASIKLAVLADRDHD